MNAEKIQSIELQNTVLKSVSLKRNSPYRIQNHNTRTAMKHHLTYQDDKSDKFWNIEISGISFTVTYGKTGTSGQTQTKGFDCEERCLKEA